MKKSMNYGILSPVFLVLGVAAMFVRRWLFTRVEDHVAYLLPRLTLPEIILWVLTAAAIVGAFTLTRKTTLTNASTLSAVTGDVLLAGGILLLFFEEVTGPSALVLLYRVFCGLSIVSLLATVLLTGTHKKVPFLLHLSPCILMVLQLLICYQLWSEVPQLMNYVLGLGAVLCLALAGYFRLARAAGLPDRSWYHAIGLLGIYFCAGAAGQGAFSLFFTTAAIWLAYTYAGLRPAEA